MKAEMSESKLLGYRFGLKMVLKDFLLWLFDEDNPGVRWHERAVVVAIEERQTESAHTGHTPGQTSYWILVSFSTSVGVIPVVMPWRAGKHFMALDVIPVRLVRRGNRISVRPPMSW